MPDTATVPDTYAWFIDQAKRVKEGTVADYDGTDQTTDDISPAVHVAGETPFPFEIMAIAPQIDRDQGLAIAHILVSTCQPDYVTFMADAHVAVNSINPATGKQWGPGEMQAACDVDGACAVGVLDDCLVFHTLWADGRARIENHRYTVTKGKGKGASTIRWSGYTGTEDVMVIDTAEGNGTVSGLVGDQLKAAYSPDNEARRIIEMALSAFSPEDAFCHSLVGAVTALSQRGSPAMVFTNNETLVKRLDEVFR